MGELSHNPIISSSTRPAIKALLIAARSSWLQQDCHTTYELAINEARMTLVGSRSDSSTYSDTHECSGCPPNTIRKHMSHPTAPNLLLAESSLHILPCLGCRILFAADKFFGSCKKNVLTMWLKATRSCAMGMKLDAASNVKTFARNSAISSASSQTQSHTKLPA
eukprot:1101425-Amphidinium_carterae.1